MQSRTLLFLAGSAIFGAASVGCSAGLYGEATTPVYYGDYDAYYATTVPANIYAYPRVYYEGNYAYYVGGSWYYPRGNRWVIFRHPPPALLRQRPYVQQAPPAYTQPQPMYQPNPQRTYPPPATRVR